MVRQAIKIDVPEHWRKRRKAGLCPVCGKTQEEFDKGQRVFCSKNCREEYASKYTYWSEIRDKILSKHGIKCMVCGIDQKKRDRERKEAKKEFLKRWIKENPKKLQIERDKRLVALDASYKKDYDRIMNDIRLAKTIVPYSEEQKFMKNVPYNVRFEVDHIVPVANGGDMWDENNMQVLCETCHKKKTKKDIKKISINKKIKKMKAKGQKTVSDNTKQNV